MPERDQILAGAVHDLEHAGITQQLGDRFGHAGDGRVDQKHFVTDGDLHQGQHRPPSAFADEFGIQTNALGRAVEVSAEVVGLVDPEMRHAIFGEMKGG